MHTGAMQNEALAAHEELVRWWAGKRIDMKTRRVSIFAIEQFEKRHAITLPPPFRHYLANASPVDNPSCNSELTAWWRFEDLETVVSGYQHSIARDVAPYSDMLVLFADFSIWSWA